MADVLQFWHISCRSDIENMDWALTWELLKLYKLLNIYAPKASTSAWDFIFNNFFSTYIYIYIYIYPYTYIYIYIYIYVYLYIHKYLYIDILKPNSQLDSYQYSFKSTQIGLVYTMQRILLWWITY